MAPLASLLKRQKTEKRHEASHTQAGQSQLAPLEMQHSPLRMESDRREPPLDTTDQLFPGSPFDDNLHGAMSYPAGDFRNATVEEVNDVKCDVMVNHLHAQQEERLWTTAEKGEGVVLKKSRGDYTSAPPDLAHERGGLFQAIETLNVKVEPQTTDQKIDS